MYHVTGEHIVGVLHIVGVPHTWEEGREWRLHSCGTDSTGHSSAALVGSADVGEGQGWWQPRLAGWQRRGERLSSFLNSGGVSSSSLFPSECRRAEHTQEAAGPWQAHTPITTCSHTALSLIHGCRDFLDQKPESIFGCEMSRSCLLYLFPSRN